LFRRKIKMNKQTEPSKPKEYVEIVHTDMNFLSLFEGASQGLDEKIARVRQLEETADVHHIDGKLNENFPDIPFDTPIRVGGGLWELCVQDRLGYLRSEGYRNVIADPSISFSDRDYIDAGM
jgi:hypothetical protein